VSCKISKSALVAKMTPSEFDARHDAAQRRKEKINAGWSSPVARLAHNQEVGSSNLPPATKLQENHVGVASTTEQ
jgi:hypothetical protein